ncbi:Wadjet anti-phage system protein JetD domain-containing protein [Sanguibacter sp. A247]|uniref:Wadjet anti-phage system protein JetD domain-containing protein n=1 Tax=Sanguibacter sp. A247 TaxID=3457327 RepID=UPI003FD721F8
MVDSDPMLRVRFLDATLAPGGMADFAAPVQQLAALDVEPRILVLLENRETLLSLPAMPGIVAVHSPGYAVEMLDPIGWVRNSPVVYWGDLDSHGFSILHRLRTHHDRVESVLMDTETLEAHLDLAVVEPRPARGIYPTLTEAESTTLERLRAGGDLRLEQERIPWEYALTQLNAAITPPRPTQRSPM